MAKDRDRFIRLRGVRQNNLKGFDLDIPLGELTVVTGLSGSGKSSLVFETLHAEGQRRYVETFSPYTRQFLEIMDRPDVDSIENIRPSIAIQQSNTVKTSRSTVGTMTELCDFFKIWFCHVSELYDPDTHQKIEKDTPESIWKKSFKNWPKEDILLCFQIKKPQSLEWEGILTPLIKQGYIRSVVHGKVIRLESINPKTIQEDSITIVQDRITLIAKNRTRFLESAQMALHFGNKELFIFNAEGSKLGYFSEKLQSSTGKRFPPPSPALFSFNSPIGACPKCRGFGRTIDIDYNLVIPNKNLTLKQGAIRPFHGEVYGQSLQDLLKCATRLNIRTDTPWSQLTDKERELIIEGEPKYRTGEALWTDAWYGVRGFFDWLESKSYKMHVRFLLSKYRSYKTCDVCHGGRLQANALNWKWLGQYTLPDLYEMNIRDLYQLLKKNHKETGNHPVDLAEESILTRLNYLNEVGLAYLTLNRTSRTLSGGEVERVNLTACLGTSLIDTLFVLDEPSVGLHSRDIDRLVTILRRLTDMGNTVIVVEHDEAIMRAADNIIEIGPEPGSRGGHIVYAGPINKLFDSKTSLTAAFLKGEKNIDLPIRRRSKIRKQQPFHVDFKGIYKNNIKNLDISIPLKQFVCLTGVSGSGKSTLLDNVVCQGLLIEQDKPVEDPAVIKSIKSNLEITNVVLVDQSPISKTPRSNPALYIDAWDSIRQLFATGLMGKSADMKPSHFSFNSGAGRCEHCHGLGYEKVEMQFLSDVYVTCPVCEGKRFKPEILDIKWNHKSITDVLEMDVVQACEFFKHYPDIRSRLGILKEVGLGYLTLGQPLNTLSGGESQRLKLVKYLSLIENKGHTMLLLDEPTTGLHRGDIRSLLKVLQKLVTHGHSLVVIEHQMDVIKSADWIIELGPDAGDLGGKIIAQGTPEQIVRTQTPSTPFLIEALNPEIRPKQVSKIKERKRKKPKKPRAFLELVGAREHNLKNISVAIPHQKMTVLTGVSGSGKSSLAFDIIFAEGQRRFMESVSAYARQYIEQMPRPDIDLLTGISPTVAIEQRVTRGTSKSTVATVTEVAQYLRLLFARVGIQYSPKSGKPVVSMDVPALTKNLEKILENNQKADHLYLCTPLVLGKKGHHEPIATWAEAQGYHLLRIDGQFVEINKFKKLDRYKEHDIELIITDLKKTQSTRKIQEQMEQAIELGKGSALLVNDSSQILSWFSTKRADPITGEAFPELDPKHLSWNSPKGWCPTCHGHGRYYDWMRASEDYPKIDEHVPDGAICPECHGERLNLISRNVKIHTKSGESFSLPKLLGLTPSKLLEVLNNLALDDRGQQIVKELLPQITERLQFMDQVGLDYLSLDRSSSTLSGGEAQRIRLASQLSSNLSGVLYVLDEPSIGLHARDSMKLIESLKNLRSKGNTLLIVEHDDEMMRHADEIIDLGPGAGIHGGEVLAIGKLNEIIKNENSLTGKYLKTRIPHPLRGQYRKLPKENELDHWLILEEAHLRNLKGDTLRIPIGCLIQVCGISGAGKSTMIRDLLKPSVAYAIEHNKAIVTAEEVQNAGILASATENQKLTLLPFKKLINGNLFKKVIEVDQEPIGKTLRSTPATYIGAFDIIRDLYASLAESKIHGFTKSHFSFNTKGGRCETCQGSGRIKLEMNFLPDTYVTCETCNGKRYSLELEDIRWNGKNIAEVLEMSFEEAVTFFSFHSRLKALMELMVETGLGYLTLGQSSPTLSGGEAQRLKLVTELAKGLPTYKEKRRGISPKNLYILEEPTIGLHLSDCERLIHILQRLVDQGHTVIVIEHHLDLIAEGDYIVEIGPEGGEQGGHILYQGKAKGILSSPKSQTASFLKNIVN